jgi:hypothetical protein
MALPWAAPPRETQRKYGPGASVSPRWREHDKFFSDRGAFRCDFSSFPVLGGFPMKFVLIATMSLSAVLLTACGPSPEQVAREMAVKKMEQAAKEMEAAGKRAEDAANKGDPGAAMGEAMKALGALAGAASGAAGAAGAASYDPVDFRKLKEVLPVELAGFEKGDSEGAKNSAMGITVSEAKQTFRTADGQKSVRFEITDPGSLAGPFALAHVWLNIEVDKETSNGYEKTTTVSGRRVHEKWSKGSKQGEVQTVVGKRFLVEVEARGLEMNEVKSLLSKIDLGRLEAMREEGRKS